MNKRCLAMYSGGLDSIVSIKLLQEQGIEVLPLFFSTPFFGYNALKNPEDFISIQKAKFGIIPKIIDYTESFIKILSKPRYGYGENFNPCIDCKIGMLSIARELMDKYDASFISTGEVIGQRPMSQRRDSMNIISRDSNLKGRLLRPLCAQSMPETEAEKSGIVDRQKLMGISGRGRKPQELLALRFGINKEDIPTPAGGCLLTYENTARKVMQTFETFSPDLPSKIDVLLDTAGRKFKLDEKTFFIVSRDEIENDLIANMKASGNLFIKISDIPGPLCILRGNINQDNIEKAASICLRYGKGKNTTGLKALTGYDPDNFDGSLIANVLDIEQIKGMQIDFSR